MADCKLRGDDGFVEFLGGAVRTPDLEGLRYDLISPSGLRRLAATCAEGAAKYGAYNWEAGMPIHDLLNHTIAHIFKYLAGDRTEDHLGHGAWGLFAAMHSEELWAELNAGTLRREGCRPPEPSGEGHETETP